MRQQWDSILNCCTQVACNVGFGLYTIDFPVPALTHYELVDKLCQGKKRYRSHPGKRLPLPIAFPIV